MTFSQTKRFQDGSDGGRIRERLWPERTNTTLGGSEPTGRSLTSSCPFRSSLDSTDIDRARASPGESGMLAQRRPWASRPVERTISRSEIEDRSVIEATCPWPSSRRTHARKGLRSRSRTKGWEEIGRSRRRSRWPVLRRLRSRLEEHDGPLGVAAEDRHRSQ